MGELILIAGEPKTGKTVSACTFPKPALMMDFDDGFSSAKKTKDSTGKLVVPDWEQIKIVPFKKEKVYNIDFKTPKKDEAAAAREHTEGCLELMSKYNKIINELAETQCYSEGIGQKGPYKTLIIDPLSVVFRIWKNATQNANKILELRLSDYKTLDGVLFDQFIPTLKSLSEHIPWILLINHEDTDTNKDGGILKEYPMGPSAKMGKAIGGSFDEVWRQTVEGNKYIWRTKEHGLFRGAGSRADIPDNINPATYQNVKKYFD